MTNKFTENGFNDTQARVLADSISHLRDESVTKDHFNAELARVNSDIGEIKAGFSKEVREFKLKHSVDSSALRGELMTFRVETGKEFSAIRERLGEFRLDVAKEFRAVRENQAEFKAEVAKEFRAVRENQAEFRAEVAEYRAEVKSEMSELYVKFSNEMIKLRKTFITWLVGAVGVFGAIVFTIDKWLGA